jgi:PST family polysaccharide transporter
VTPSEPDSSLERDVGAGTATTHHQLGRSAARGGAITLAGQVARFAVQTLGIVVLSRMLDPGDFGFLAMVTAVVGLGELIRDFGLSYAAIAARTLSRQQRDNLFWINSALGVIFACIVWLAAPAIAAFYDEQALVAVARILGLTFILNGVATQYRAGLVRDLRFLPVALLDVAAPALGVTIAILMAADGAGYWALVGQEIAKSVVLTVGAIAVARWMPRLPRRGAGMRPLISYGAHLFGSYALTYASKNVDTAVIGWRFGAVTTGLYSRAYQLMALPLTQLSFPITKVAMPVLSRLQDETAAYRRFLERGQTLLLNAMIPVFALGFAFASPVIMIVLGNQWMGAVPYFRVLALGGAFEAAGFVVAWIFQSRQATRAQLRFSLVSRPLTIALILAGSLIGPVGVAGGYAVGALVSWPLGLWWAGRAGRVPVMPLFWSGLRSLAAYTVVAAGGWLASTAVSSGSPILELAVGLAASAVMVALVAFVWPSFRHDLRALREAVSLLRRPQLDPV